MAKRPAFGLLGIIVAFAVSCGGNDPLIQAMADEMISQADGISTEPSETLCVSEASYEILGPDRLEELGVTVENPNLLNAVVTEDEAAELVDALYSCVDVDEMVVSLITARGLPIPAAECIIETLGDESIRQFILDQFQGEGLALTPEAQTAMLSCLSEDS